MKIYLWLMRLNISCQTKQFKFRPTFNPWHNRTTKRSPHPSDYSPITMIGHLLPPQVACGLNHTLVVSADGMMVWAFGDGDYGKLGLGNSTAKSSPQVGAAGLWGTLHLWNYQYMIVYECFLRIWIIQKVDILCGINIKKVACGTQFSVALTKDGRVFTFGQGRLQFSVYLHAHLLL